MDLMDKPAVRQLAVDTLAYMRQTEKAPPLLAGGLSEDYRLLAEFNRIVLAEHEREAGHSVEFVTWERIRNNTRLWQGHYYDNNYAAAKQDFFVRSGLILSSRIFAKEQLAVIYDAVQNMTTLDLDSNPEQGKFLEGILDQIEKAMLQVIDLANDLTQSPKPEEMQLY